MKEYDPARIVFGDIAEAAGIVDTAIEGLTARTSPVLKEIFKREVGYRLFRLRYGNP